MKPRSSRVSALAVGVLALSALAGFTGASPASAASWTHLCVDDPEGVTAVICAYSQGLDNLVAAYEEPVNGTTNWTYPNANNAEGEIKQANVNLCMQVDAAAGDHVRGAACVGDQAEEWINIYFVDPSTGRGRTVFESVWALDNGQGNLCLQASNYLILNYCPRPIGQGAVADLWYEWGTS